MDLLALEKRWQPGLSLEPVHRLPPSQSPSSPATGPTAWASGLGMPSATCASCLTRYGWPMYGRRILRLTPATQNHGHCLGVRIASNRLGCRCYGSRLNARPRLRMRLG